MRYLDLQSTNDIFEHATSARKLSELGKQVDDYRAYEKLIIEAQDRHNTIIEEGAKANIEQKELLLWQLEALKEQNKLLEKQINEIQDKNALLNDLYEGSKKEASKNAKDALHNKIFGWVSFSVGTLIGIVGIILGIIF